MMKVIKKKVTPVLVDIHQMKHLQFDFQDGDYVVTLIDQTGYEILKGYGTTILEAINDLHYNLL